MRKRGILAIGWGYAMAMVLLVLGPISDPLNRLTVKLYVFWTDTLHLGGGLLPRDFGNLLNVLLFVPLGALIVLLVRWPWWVATLTAVLVSVVIELAQVIPALHRDSSVTDVVTNGLGGLIGALLVVALIRRHERRDAEERVDS